MGLKAMEWVWDNYIGKASNRVILLRIAHHANDETGEAFPSVETLRLKAKVSERYAHTIIKELQTEGYISVESGGGRASNTYRILGYIAVLKGVSQTPSPLMVKSPLTSNNNNITPDSQITPEMTPTSPLRGTIHHPTPDSQITPPLIPKSPELSFNYHLSIIEQTEKEKSIVAPVGDDTAPTPLLVSQTITPESKDTHQPSETVKPTNTATHTVEELPKRKLPPKTNSVDNTTIQTNTPPIAPPRADKVRVLTDHQQMVGAIVKAFGWSFNKMTKNNRGLVGKVARELLEASATPDQIPALYEFCKGQKWSNGIFSPAALSSQWANFCATVNQTAEILPVWTAPEGYVGFKHDYSKRVADMTDEEFNTAYPNSANLTYAELKQKMRETMSNMVHKFTTVEELPIPEDDPMNEALTW